jgi:hypothetical protein
MKKIISILIISIIATLAFGQKNDTTLYNLGKGFESPKIDGSKFSKIKVNVGGDFAIHFQSLKSHADSAMAPLGGNLNLPAANLNINAFLAPGIKVNLTTYLASRHHTNTYVQGGYILIDELPFLHSEVADNIMKYFTVKVGMMELNYGDAHFRRSDNAKTLNNPFIGNYILDGFAVSPAAEIYFRPLGSVKGLLLMAGATNCVTDPNVGLYTAAGTSNYTFPATHYSATYSPLNLGKILGYYFKVAYDKDINDNIKIRPSISAFRCYNSPGGALYNSDRGGSPYDEVMNKVSLGSSAYDATSNVTNGYFGPGNYSRDQSFMGNLFARIYNFELFGTYEVAKGNTGLAQTYNVVPFTFTNSSIEGIYYFGKHHQFDVGARYTSVHKNAVDGYGYNTITKKYNIAPVGALLTSRVQAVIGWKLTDNIVTKLEYCKQNYSNYITYGTSSIAFFEGFMVEAAISF